MRNLFIVFITSLSGAVSCSKEVPSNTSEAATQTATMKTSTVQWNPTSNGYLLSGTIGTDIGAPGLGLTATATPQGTLYGWVEPSSWTPSVISTSSLRYNVANKQYTFSFRIAPNIPTYLQITSAAGKNLYFFIPKPSSLTLTTSIASSVKFARSVTSKTAKGTAQKGKTYNTGSMSAVMSKASEYLITNYITGRSPDDLAKISDPGTCIDGLFTSAITSTVLGFDITKDQTSLNTVFNGCISGSPVDASVIAAAAAAAAPTPPPATVPTCTTLTPGVDYFDGASIAIVSKLSANYANFANLTFAGVARPGTISGSVNKLIYYLSYDYLSLHSDSTTACKVTNSITDPTTIPVVQNFLLSPTTAIDSDTVSADIQTKILNVYAQIKTLSSTEVDAVVTNYISDESAPLVAAAGDAALVETSCFEAAAPALARIEHQVAGVTYFNGHLAGSVDPDPVRLRCMALSDILY